MIDSPSIVPDLSDLAKLVSLVEQYAATSCECDTEAVLADMRAEERAICSRSPALEMPAHSLVEGALFIRRQAEAGRANGAKNRKSNHSRNVDMAAECIRRRADPTNDGVSDRLLMQRVGALPRFRLAFSQARAAIIEGMRDPRNQERIKQFGERGNPNKRRSIFDGSKESNCRCQTTTSTHRPPSTITP